MTKVGDRVKGLKEGDYVVPAKVRAWLSRGSGKLVAEARHCCSGLVSGPNG